jgi:hypothetical protein
MIWGSDGETCGKPASLPDLGLPDLAGPHVHDTEAAGGVFHLL